MPNWKDRIDTIRASNKVGVIEHSDIEWLCGTIELLAEGPNHMVDVTDMVDASDGETNGRVSVGLVDWVTRSHEGYSK